MYILTIDIYILGKTIIIDEDSGSQPGEACGDALHPTAAASSLCGRMVPCPCAPADSRDSAGRHWWAAAEKSDRLKGFMGKINRFHAALNVKPFVFFFCLVGNSARNGNRSIAMVGFDYECDVQPWKWDDLCR